MGPSSAGVVPIWKCREALNPWKEEEIEFYLYIYIDAILYKINIETNRTPRNLGHVHVHKCNTTDASRSFIVALDE